MSNIQVIRNQNKWFIRQFILDYSLIYSAPRVTFYMQFGILIFPSAKHFITFIKHFSHNFTFIELRCYIRVNYFQSTPWRLHLPRFLSIACSSSSSAFFAPSIKTNVHINVECQSHSRSHDLHISLSLYFYA